MHLPVMNKVWGWFVTKPLPSSYSDKYIHIPAWCYWGHVGKTINVTAVTTGRCEYLSGSKTVDGYHSISHDELLSLWPTFYEDLHIRMIAETLIRNG